MTTPEDSVQHRAAAGQGAFTIERGGKRIAELTYSMSGDDVVVGHTWVDPEHRGGTLAPDLVAAVVAWARGNRRRIVPVCSYVRKVFTRTPAQYEDVWRK
jgi:uncharacterized protein